MSVAERSTSLPRRVLRREIGRAGGDPTGPTLIVVAGIHGNEPAGLDASARVFAHLEEHRVRLHGRFVALAGNLGALAAGERFLREDLNRMWTADRVARVRNASDDGSDGALQGPEAAEQRSLLDALQEILASARGPVYVIDLHTSSSQSAPFYVLGDTLRNREFARRFPATTVLGLEEHIRGTLNEYLTSLGHVAVAIEGGQHADPAAVDHHEAALWLALASIGCLDAAAVPGYAQQVARLTRPPGTMPGVVEIFHRHPISEADEFRMDAGWVNFSPVRKGQRLAVDRKGEVRSPADGFLFLPLYQKRGEDGFFLARGLNPLWLATSSWLRRVGAPSWATLLPGVTLHPERRDTLVVNLSIARFFARGLFHLLGYRVSTRRLGKMLVQRRQEEP
ncbi:MAG: succinylglutamate desuccinylase/aspartoacylase family protein [bacterium]